MGKGMRRIRLLAWTACAYLVHRHDVRRQPALQPGVNGGVKPGHVAEQKWATLVR